MFEEAHISGSSPEVRDDNVNLRMRETDDVIWAGKSSGFFRNSSPVASSGERVCVYSPARSSPPPLVELMAAGIML